MVSLIYKIYFGKLLLYEICEEIVDYENNA